MTEPPHGDGWVAVTTMEKIFAQELIDVEHPEKSQFLLKPAGLMKHGGGPKFLPGDATYYNWKAKYGGMEASEIKRLKEL